MRNCGLVIQPFGIPEAPKCEAIRSGSSGKSWTHCVIAATTMAKNRPLGKRVPGIFDLPKTTTRQLGRIQENFAGTATQRNRSAISGKSRAQNAKTGLGAAPLCLKGAGLDSN